MIKPGKISPAKTGPSPTAKSRAAAPRRKALDSAQNCRTRYEELFKNIPSGVAVYEAVDGGRDFVFREFNPAAEKIEGVRRADLLGRRVTEAFPGVAAFGILDVFRRVWATGSTESFPARVYKDARDPGTWRENWVYKLPGGEIVAVYQDITARKQAESALREDEERYRSLFETANDGIHLLRGEVFVDCNRRALEMFGCADKSELIGRTPAEFSPPLQPDGQASADKARANLEAATQGIPQRFAWQHIRRDGSPFDAEVALNSLNLGGEVFIQAIVRDVSQRKGAEEALAAERGVMRTLIDNLPDNVFIKDVRGGIILDNLSHRRLLGRQALTDVVGKSDRDFFPPALADRYANDERQIIASGLPLINYEEPTIDTEGRLHWYLTTKIPVRDGQGAITALVGINRDITERKRAEEEIQQSLREKEALLREVYHRTKNNMNVIGSMLSLRAHTLDDKKTIGVFREIEDKIRVMALVHKKLYESGDLSRIDLRDYIAELTAQLIQSHKDMGTTLTASLDLEKLPIPIDIAIPCGMILNELFSNAVKHAFAGRDSGRIRIRLGHAGATEIELDFADNGTGVPMGFDFRAQHSLGLQTLFMLAEHQLQGTVRFESETGGGLACRIRFPEKPGLTGGRP